MTTTDKDLKNMQRVMEMRFNKEKRRWGSRVPGDTSRRGWQDGGVTKIPDSRCHPSSPFTYRSSSLPYSRKDKEKDSREKASSVKQSIQRERRERGEREVGENGATTKDDETGKGIER